MCPPSGLPGAREKSTALPLLLCALLCHVSPAVFKIRFPLSLVFSRLTVTCLGVDFLSLSCLGSTELLESVGKRLSPNSGCFLSFFSAGFHHCLLSPFPLPLMTRMLDLFSCPEGRPNFFSLFSLWYSDEKTYIAPSSSSPNLSRFFFFFNISVVCLLVLKFPFGSSLYLAFVACC